MDRRSRKRRIAAESSSNRAEPSRSGSWGRAGTGVGVYPGAAMESPPDTDERGQPPDGDRGPAPGGLIPHAPLKRWSPLSKSERREARAFIDRLSEFPYLTLGTVAFLCWAYMVQLVLGWPFTWLLLPDDSLGISVTMSLGGHLGWLSPDEVLAGEWWRLLSATMLHGSLLHVAGNCWLLYVLGKVVENTYGRAAFLAIFVVAGGVGSALSLTTGVDASIGASGAVLGLLGAALALGIRHKDKIPRAVQTFFRVDLWVLVLAVAGISALPFVDWAGHLGGFLAGMVMGMLWPPSLLLGVISPSVRAVGTALATLAVGCVLYTTVQVGFRVTSVQEETVIEDLRSLQAAVLRGDKQAERIIVLRILEKEPKGGGDLWGMLLIDVGEYARAVELLQDAERDNPRLSSNPSPYWDNNLAWALFMAHPDDPEQVDEGLMRVRRALKEVNEDPIVRNTLAYGLYLDGQAREAERVIKEVMLGKPEAERGADIYIHVLALAAMGEPERAVAEYHEALEKYPDGELLDRATEGLRAQGLLPPEEVPEAAPEPASEEEPESEEAPEAEEEPEASPSLEAEPTPEEPAD